MNAPTIKPESFEAYEAAILTGQVSQEDAPALLEANPVFANWYHERAAERRATRTGTTPLLDEHRLIDGVWHVWCGGGWIAQCYADNVVWHIQVTKKNGDKPPAIRMGAAPKRPVAFRAKNELGVWIYYEDEARAAAAAEKLGTEYQGLYVRDGT